MSKKKRQRGKGVGRQGAVPAANPPPPPAAPGLSGARRLALLGVLVAAVLGVAFLLWPPKSAPPPVAEVPRATAAASPTFVGAQACAGCHAKEVEAWRGSQHAMAMQDATDATVRGAFDGTRLTAQGVTSTFLRKDGKFVVNTDGPDGKLADFEVKYTFGVAPLQQYLVEFPGGRYQALPLAWDTRDKAAGGQRWFHLYPGETHLDHRDPLHWTRLNQNWNYMCADCHSTNLRRGYDLATDTYHTTWSELNVACEACHGPASGHVKQKQGGGPATADHGFAAPLDERDGVRWIADAATGNATRSAPLATHRELDACGQCHARRAPFADGLRHGAPLMDSQDPVLLTEGLYHVDGQQLDEVYDHGSFLQSRMHAQGVTCSDCHEPHGGKLRAQGNAVCAQCHQTAKYDAPSHTLHPAGSPGAQCAACHMPTRTYMVVDPRHDHSIRIPRPDLSQTLGTPNACNSCHADRSPDWAAGVIERAHGPKRKGFQTFASALQAGRSGAPGAAAQLESLLQDPTAPAIARATGLSLMRGVPGPRLTAAIERGVADPDPLVRGAALEALTGVEPAVRAQLAAGLLDDPVGVVRIKAARALAFLQPNQVGAAWRGHLERGFADYVASQQASADRPEAHVNLGLFYSERGDATRAENEYRTALRLQPDFVPATVNLADLFRALAREAEAEALLTTALERVPEDGDLLHALALGRARGGRIDEAVPLLARAAKARADNPRYAYVYAVALHDHGDRPGALDVLNDALRRFPNDRQMLAAASGYSAEAGKRDAALDYARRLAAFAADDPTAAEPLRALETR